MRNLMPNISLIQTGLTFLPQRLQCIEYCYNRLAIADVVEFVEELGGVFYVRGKFGDRGWR